jgi:hypothetical protein
MANFGINFGDPKGFADWTKYAGFDANKPMMGIAPPSQDAKTPVSPTFAQIGQRLSDVGGQLGQGNFMGAMKAYQGAPSTPGLPALPVPGAPAAPVDKDGDGMISEWEE